VNVIAVKELFIEKMAENFNLEFDQVEKGWFERAYPG
jgi:hypothetical protein